MRLLAWKVGFQSPRCENDFEIYLCHFVATKEKQRMRKRTQRLNHVKMKGATERQKDSLTEKQKKKEKMNESWDGHCLIRQTDRWTDL